jgi:iron complex transport system substrate-binding protein
LNLKRSITIIGALIILVASMAGCIEIDNKNGDDKVTPFVTTSEIFVINQSKNIVMDDSSYNITLINIDSLKITIIINSDANKVFLNLGIPAEVDSDFDGRNELEINVTDITQNDATIEFKAISSTSNYLYIEDDTGNLVKVPKKIEKIISLAASITEILFELGHGDKIVGRDSGSNYPEDATKIEVVSTYEGINLEKILAAEPDVILLDKILDMTDNNYNKLHENGLTVFRVYPQKLNDVLENIILIGKVIGKEPEAIDLAADLEARINTVKTRGDEIPAQEQSVVLYVIYYDGTSSPWVGTTSTISGDLIKIAGGVVAIDDSTGFSIQITVEELIAINPDVILTSQDDTWPTPSKDSILNDDVLSDVKAVKSGNVYDVNADLVDRPGPRMVDGLELISGYLMQ